MSELVFDKDIELRPHAIDRYGRTVAQVGVNGKDIGVEMIRQGLAWVPLHHGGIHGSSGDLSES